MSPVYDYQCPVCGYQIEHECKIVDRPEAMPCDLKCKGQMCQIIVAPAIQVDTAQDIPWLDEFARTRKEARYGGKPIQTRAEYKQYLKDHDLRPCSGENLSEV